MSYPVSPRKSAAAGLICALIVLLWQFLTVRYNYHGDWSALFCTGENVPLPPIVASEHPYEFTGTKGWDGQLYHAIAHDPLFRRGSAVYIEAARLRYRRILIPLAAYLLAGGNDRFVDAAYRSVILLFFALGAGWLAQLLQAAGQPAVVGLAFMFLPASIASLDRQAVDVGLLAFCCAFVLYTRYFSKTWILYAVLLCAGLVRDTGLLLTAAYCVWLLLRREVRKCALFGTAAAPTLAWYLFVKSRTVPYGSYGSVAFPFSGVVDRFLHPLYYAGGSLKVGVVRGADLLAAAGVLAAMLWAFRFIRRRNPDPVHLAIALFALVGIFVWPPNDWLEALDFARILSPLLFFEALAFLEGPLVPALLPLGMVLPRFGVQVGPQAIGVVRGLLGGA